MKKLSFLFLFTINTILNLIKCDYFSISLDRSKLKSTKDNLSNSLNLLQSDETLLHSLESINDHHKLLGLIQNKTENVAAVPVTSYFNVQYYGSVYIGSQFQEMSVIFDTGSNILWVSAADCLKCRNFTSKFASNTSESFESIGDVKNITYAIGYVNGTYVRDNVYMTKNLVGVDKENRAEFEYSMGVDNFKFLLVDDEQFLDGTIADGVLGLGIDFEGDEQNSFVYSLYKEGKIKNPYFSFYLTDSKKGSRLYLGDITENKALDFVWNKISYCDLKNKSRYWQCEVSEIEFKKEEFVVENGEEVVIMENSTSSTSSGNSKMNKTTLSITSQVIFDSGTSYLIIPANDFIMLLPHFANKAFENKCGVTPYLQFICQCKSPKDFDDMVLNFKSASGVTTKFVINSENLIEYYPTLKYQCRFELMIDIFMMDAWILGDSVLRNSLVTFDMKNRQVGWVQDIDRISDEVMINEEDNNTDESFNTTSTSTNNSQFIWYLLAIIIIIAISYFIVKLAGAYARRSENNNSNVDQVPLNREEARQNNNI